MNYNPTHAELVEELRKTSNNVGCATMLSKQLAEAASFIESQASRIEELEADNKRLADLVVAIQEAVRSSGRAALKPARDGV